MRIRVAISVFFLYCFTTHSAFCGELAASLPLFGIEGVSLNGTVPPGLKVVAQRWAEALEHQKKYGSIGSNNDMPAPTLKQWETLVARFPKMDAAEQLRGINGFFNGWSQISDQQAYGQEEYWACAGEFLEKGGGDCEDFAISKYIALRQLGWPSSSLWLVVVKDLPRNQGHAVLAARFGKSFFILDNLCRPSYLIIDHMFLSKQYVPVVAMNEDDIWVFPAAYKNVPSTGNR